jgi:hypothetical protein
MLQNCSVSYHSLAVQAVAALWNALEGDPQTEVAESITGQLILEVTGLGHSPNEDIALHAKLVRDMVRGTSTHLVSLVTRRRLYCNRFT